MVCLDSDILVSFLRGDRAAVEKVSALRAGRDGPLRTTAINVYELMKGARMSQSREANEAQVRELVAALEVFGLDLEASEECADTSQGLRAGGSAADEMDVLIAGVAVRNGEKLVSRDEGFRGMPRLRLESW